MKKIFLLLFCVSIMSAQSYRTLTIREIQEVPDSLLNLSPAKDASKWKDSTVWVTGVVQTPIRWKNDSLLWFTGDRFRFILKDPSTNAFNFISAVAVDTTWFKTNVGIDALVAGDSVKLLGKITEYRSLTQFEIIKDVNNTNVMQLLGTSNSKRDAIERPLSDFYNSATLKVDKKNPGEKYESGFVKFTNLTVLDNVGAEFTVADAQGNKIRVDDQSNFIYGRIPPPAGSLLNFVQGYLYTNSTSEWTINPKDRNDFQISGTAPSIQSIFRSDTFPTPSSQVNIKAKVYSVGSSVSSVQLFYSVNGIAKGKIEMVQGINPDSIYFATIPATNLEDGVVSYHILATNPQNYSSTFPADTTKEKLFYLTFSHPIRIQDIQFNPFGGGSSYNNVKVTVKGIATSDRKDYGAINVQSENGKWSGIRVRSTADSIIRRGQELNIYGLVREMSGLTVLDSSKLTIVNASATLPTPSKIKTSEILNGGVSAESWESVLIELDSVYVVRLNEDSPSNQNFGEWGMSETKTNQVGLRVDDYSTKIPFSNDTARAQGKGKIQLKVGDFFAKIIAPLDYSFSNFKLIPRDSADFVGYKQAMNVKKLDENIPLKYNLSQNFPNPFNPSTTIYYSIKNENFVSLKVFDLLGKEIEILVDGKQSAGNYSVRFNPKNLSTGIYIYRLSVAGFAETKKMMFVK